MGGDVVAVLLMLLPLAAILAPVVLIIFSKRATARRKALWLGLMVAGYIVGEVAAGMYARGRVNPMNPEFADLLAAMVIELSSTITLVWLAYIGFLLHTRRRKAQ